jgi:hypothetical protein
LQAANAAAFLTSLTALGGNLSTIVAGMTTFVTTTITGLAGLSDACKDIFRLDRWALTWPLTTVPAPRIVATGNAVADGAVDNDGLVEYDSAMGLRLGTGTNEFFDHTGGGSWYRRYRSDVEQFSHEAMRRETGAWIWDTIVSRGAGPLPSGAGELSVFP